MADYASLQDGAGEVSDDGKQYPMSWPYVGRGSLRLYCCVYGQLDGLAFLNTDASTYCGGPGSVCEPGDLSDLVRHIEAEAHNRQQVSFYSLKSTF